MPQVLIAASEGEHALWINTLSVAGADDKHRGSVEMLDPELMFRAIDPATTSDDMWFHVLARRGTGSNNGGTARDWFNIRDSSGNLLAGLRDAAIDFSSDFVFVTRRAGSSPGTITSGTFVYEFNNSVFIDIDIRIRRSTVTDPNDTLTIDWYFEQQLRETRVVTRSSGWDKPVDFILSSLFSIGGGSTGRDLVYFQDVIVTDAVPTVGMELVTMQPAASGFYSQWTNNYTNIDEAGYDPDDLMFATTAALRESFIHVTPTFDTSDKIIYAFVLSFVGQTDLGNQVADFQPFLRINAIDYAGTNVGAINLAPNNYINIWTENPATLSPWVQADFDGLESGFLTV